MSIYFINMRFWYVCLVVFRLETFGSQTKIQSTNFMMTNSILVHRKMLMVLLVVFGLTSCLSMMVLMQMIFTKGKSWVTVGFFQLCHRWQEYQEITMRNSKNKRSTKLFKNSSIVATKLKTLVYFDSR